MSRQPSDASPGSASPSDPESPSSRSRRRLLSAVGVGGVLATAGCLSALGSSGESNADVGLTLDRLELTDGFEDESASLGATYGEHGVWGLAGSPSIDGPTYAGAYRDSLAVPGDGDANVDPWATADAAAVVYRLDGDGQSTYRVWLWAGARARQPDEGIGRASVTRVSVGATPGRGWTLADYAPRTAFREGPVPVSLGEGGPSGRTPLPGGGIAPDEEGADGRVGVAWQGIARGTRSVNAVCAFRPADAESDPPFEARVSFGVGGGRGVL